MSYIQMQKGAGGQKPGAKYVHLAWNEWDSGAKRPVQKRFYVGRIGENGQVLLNKKFAGERDVFLDLDDLRSRAADRNACEAWLRGLAAPTTQADPPVRVEIVGDAWVAIHLAQQIGLDSLLREVFGAAEGGALLALAAHQMVTGHALYRAEAWLFQRQSPGEWTSDFVSESHVHGFVARIGKDMARRETFLERWAGREKRKTGVVLHDITSVSTHSPSLELAEWGHNRDGESLPQINLSLAAGEDGIPLFYRVVPGSIPDVRTLPATLEVAASYGIEAPCLSMDRGFYSQSNVNKLIDMKRPFIVGVPWTVKQAVEIFKKHAAALKKPRENFLHHATPLRHRSDEWRVGDHRLTLHVYMDPARHADALLRAEKTALSLAKAANGEGFKSVREAGEWIRENAGPQADCLKARRLGDGKIEVAPRPSKILAATARAGYTLVLSHGRPPGDETAEAVMRDYRARDVAEKLFDAFKTEDAQYRLRTAGDDSVQGRFFLGFLALVLRAELARRMGKSSLNRAMTTANVFDELAKCKTLVTRQDKRIPLEISKRQRELLHKLDLPPIT